ncbi:MAG: DUF4118 domain-containing protein [Pyrinomonadaceae bacterium]
MKPKGTLNSVLLRFGLSIAAVLIVAMSLAEVRSSVNATTVALAFLIVILSAATFFGRNPALLASFVAMLCFNYLFLPPYYMFTISDPQNLIAWAAFTVTALIAGELSAYANRRAREAERLYEELQTAFKNATEAEALKQSEKLRSALLDAVTHDLRTPLTSIKASVTTLLDSEGGHRTIELDSDGRADFLEVINEETDRLNGFIESMVQLAKVESGRSKGKSAFSHVEEIVSIAVDRAEKLLAGHHLIINLEKELPLIRVDARAIAEVIYNLVENAVKYSEKGTTVTITAQSHGDRVFISVEDEGKGVPEEMRERVFEKFVRLEGSVADGLGLGLAIARGIVEAQGGTIEIRSGANDKGAIVVITMPIGEE